MAYIANTDDDVRKMLATIGLKSLDDLFDMVPPEFRLNRALDVPPALGEFALTSEIGSQIAANEGADRRPCFLGGGSYDHFVPAVVDQLAARGEYYTAYTPYQAEASQGTLQATFEYQTLIAGLTGMDVSNASLYDGGSAAAEAMLMAMTVTRKLGRVVVAGTVHPEYREILRTYLANLDPELVTVPARGGKVDPADVSAAIDGRHLYALIVQHPNFFGGLEEIESLVDAAHARGALAIVSVDPIGLGLLKRPGSYGADIVIAEGQGLGNHLNYGGPYLGILACREEYVRKMPGRVVGETKDRHGKRCFTLTLQTREQHIRREKATSNICTNQGLLALRASIYLAVVGPSGLRQAAELSTVQHPLRGRLPGARCRGCRWRSTGRSSRNSPSGRRKTRPMYWPRSAGSATTAGLPWGGGSRSCPTASPRRRDGEADEGGDTTPTSRHRICRSTPLYPLGSCTMKYNPTQRAARGSAADGGNPSVPRRIDDPGDARSVARHAGDPRRDRRPQAATSNRRQRTRRGQRRCCGGGYFRDQKQTHQDPDPRQCPRHQSRPRRTPPVSRP